MSTASANFWKQSKYCHEEQVRLPWQGQDHVGSGWSSVPIVHSRLCSLHTAAMQEDSCPGDCSTGGLLLATGKHHILSKVGCCWQLGVTGSTFARFWGCDTASSSPGPPPNLKCLSGTERRRGWRLPTPKPLTPNLLRRSIISASLMKPMSTAFANFCKQSKYCHEKQLRVATGLSGILHCPSPVSLLGAPRLNLSFSVVSGECRESSILVL